MAHKTLQKSQWLITRLIVTLTVEERKALIITMLFVILIFAGLVADLVIKSGCEVRLAAAWISLQPEEILVLQQPLARTGSSSLPHCIVVLAKWDGGNLYQKLDTLACAHMLEEVTDALIRPSHWGL